MVRKDLIDLFCSILLPTCPACGEAQMVWAHLRSHKLQSGNCDNCHLSVNIQYDDNVYHKLEGDRKMVWWMGGADDEKERAEWVRADNEKDGHICNDDTEKT
jgi:hypothetical protein